MLRFIVVDDHPLFREALQNALDNAYPGCEIRETVSIDSTLDEISEQTEEFDLALLDLSLPDSSGFDGFLSIRKHAASLPVAIISGMDDPRLITEALSYGAAGFIPKSSSQDEFVLAIKKIIAGDVYTPPNYKQPTEATGDNDFRKRLTTLTPQQLRVLKMLRQGLLNKQIGDELNIGETTVKAHVSEILRKLGVYSRTQAVIKSSKNDFDVLLSTETVGTED